MILAEVLSLAVFNLPVLSLPLLVLVGVATFVLSWKNLEWGIYILFAELFFGSRGHLLEYDLGFVGLSLRLVIFFAVFMAWLLKFSIFNFQFSKQLPKSYLLLLFVICFGILNGYLHGNGIGNVFNDANGYLYLLILPAVLSAIKTRQQIDNILEILAAAIIIIALKTLTLFAWFTFGFAGVSTAYEWILRQDFGEITGVVGSASRIFMQSQFWALMGFFIFAFFEKKNWLVIAAAVLSIIMSLSRSFWLGLAAGGLFALVMLLWHRPASTRLGEAGASFRYVFSLALKILLIAAIEIVALYALVNLGGGKFAEAVASRGGNPVTEAAGNARLLQLPVLFDAIKQSPIIGSGFGKELTFKSYLTAKITKENPEGSITSYAFEWGYLDIMLKIGAVGLLVYAFFVAGIFKNLELRIENLGFLSALVALLILNITTPYLNHPLGIGYLIFVYSYLFVIRKVNEAAG